MKLRFLMKTPYLALAVLLGISAVILGNCSAEASKLNAEKAANEDHAVFADQRAKIDGDAIQIKPNSPAETVREFYSRLRDGKFRAAIFLTNLRPAVEGLTDEELKEFSVDFQALAKLVPPDLKINGEIITGDEASVMALLPSNDSEKPERQEIRLRRDGDNWVILSADETAEKEIRKEGKNYFFALRIDTHQNEAKKMMERISKAQMVFSLQNKGVYGQIDQLIAAGYLPEDIRTAESTGYLYTVVLDQDRRKYYATAVPEKYGVSGKNSYLLELSDTSLPIVTGRDNKGEPLRRAKAAEK